MGVLVTRFYSFHGELCSIRICFLATRVSVGETADNILRISHMGQVVSLFLKVWFRMDHVVGRFKFTWLGRPPLPHSFLGSEGKYLMETSHLGVSIPRVCHFPCIFQL